MPFTLADPRVNLLEKFRSHFQQPLRFNGANFPLILLSGENEFMIDYPIRILIEEGGARVNVNLLIIDQSPVAFLGIFPAAMSKEPCTNRFPNF